MKETGLMFKAPLVRAILSGQKTQTRRAFSKHMEKLMRTAAAAGEVSNFLDEGRLQPNDLGYVVDFCPLGKPGDRIYVRETFVDLHGTGVEHRPDPRGPLQRYVYAADCPPGSLGDHARQDFGLKWTPCIHMPKAAARIWLEVTGVRVERLQQMSEADAVRDGGLHRLPATGRYVINQGDQYFGLATHDPRELFQEIWESTGGDWAANPWVWVIDFKTISTTGRPA